MTHELRRLLEEELAGETPPPLGDVVRVSVDSGRRVRRRRRLFAGAGGGAAAAVLAVAGLLALGTPPPPAGQAAEAPSPTSVRVAVPSPSDPVPSVSARCVLPQASPSADDTDRSSTGIDRPAASSATPCPSEVRALDLTVPDVRPTSDGQVGRTTPESALELLVGLLPKGQTDGFAFLPEGYAHVQVYLDRGDGPGMIRVYVGGVAEPAVCYAEQTCADVVGVGLLVVEHNPTDCTRLLAVTLQRLDGVEITLQLADCLMWDGERNPAGAIALDLQEAVTLVLNPAWGPTVPDSLIKSGEFNFPKLDPIVGG
ncbi:hypothetical protein ACIA8K_00800 [Catenuloplanes sp. NPDC051500]|uniref:hypothetical protein n=1 Tax=Catenuloplanes sp. NPDC051500 TaxID=3363959 RepID=UPI0037B64CAF